MRAVLLAFARSRLVHFFVAGAVLVALAPKEKSDRAVVVDAARVEEGFRAAQARSGRALTADEKTAVVQELVDDEIFEREALRLGLGTDDPIVRVRLADQMRTSVARSLPVPTVDEAELATVATNGGERVRLAVWFVPKEAPAAEREAEGIARTIRSEGAAHARKTSAPIPDGAVWNEPDLASVAGPSVARAAFAAQVGEATIVASAWGFYVLVPLERLPVDPASRRAGALATVVRAKHEQALTRWVRRARRDYAIEVRSPAGEPRFDIDAPARAESEHVD